MLDYDMIRALRGPDSFVTKPADKPGMTPEKLKTLLEMEEIVIDRLEKMPVDVVEGYRPGLKILGEMIQKGLNGSKSPA